VASLKLSEVARLVESIVLTPTYRLLGVDYRGRLVYQTMEGGFNSIWVYEPGGDERRRLSTSVVHWAGEVSLDGRRVPFTRDVGGGRELQVIGFVDLASGEEVVLEDMEPVRVLGFWDTGIEIAFAGATKEKISLYKAGVKGVEELAKLSSYAHVSFFDGRLIVGSGNLRGNPRSSEIFVYDLKEGELKVVTPREGSVNSNPIVNGEGKIVFETDAYSGDVKELALYDPVEGVFTRLDLGGEYRGFKPVEHLYYRDFNGELYVVGKRDGRSRLFVGGRLVPTPPGTVLNAYPFEGKIYYTYTSLRKPFSIYVYESGGSREVLAPALPGDVEARLGEVEFARVKSPDGVEVPIFLFKSARPRGVALVYVHGGPWAETADAWSPLVAVPVALGFNVVAPNYRGSTGYGERFRLMDIGDPGGGDLLDVESATKWALEKGLGGRAFIWGYSYGGYMTLWAMFNRPGLYECGVAGAPVADWAEMYELSDAVFREFIKILFDNKMGLLKERSPSAYAGNLKSPLTIVQPENDTRTPLKPVLHLAEKLVEAGKTFQLHVIPGIGHAITSQEKLLQLMLYVSLSLDKCGEEH
jgi:dipeptidyl aminopeptidase/acylaminoacyl peptidase